MSLNTTWFSADKNHLLGQCVTLKVGQNLIIKNSSDRKITLHI